MGLLHCERRLMFVGSLLPDFAGKSYIADSVHVSVSLVLTEHPTDRNADEYAASHGNPAGTEGGGCNEAVKGNYMIGNYCYI